MDKGFGFICLWGIALSLSHGDEERDIAMSMGYNYTWPRPDGLSMTQASHLGLIVASNKPTAWEGAQSGSDDNIGNLIWAAGVTNLLSKSEWEKVDMLRDRVLAKKNHTWRSLVLGTGPLISWNSCSEVVSRFKYMMDIIEATSDKTPLFLFGLGVMGTCGQLRMRKGLMPYSQKLAEALQLRLESAGGLITTRGMHTWNILRWGGLTSSKFLPLCGPSLFLNTTKALGKILESKYRAIFEELDQGTKIRVGINTNHEKFSQIALRTLIESLLDQGHSVIEYMQDGGGHKTISDLHLESRRFYDVEKWLLSLRTEIDIYVGARIHGSMAAIAAGIPAITVVTDFRQSEFVSCVQVAHVDARTASNLIANKGILAFFQHAATTFNGENFDLTRFSAALDYAKAFDEVGVQLNPSVRKLAGL